MNKDDERGKIAGIVNSIERNTMNNAGEEKFHGERGHGFAAERANNNIDRILGKDAHIEGDGNEKNGADRSLNKYRSVDTIYIQSKYCKTGSRCIEHCFDNGVFRYYNNDGTPMLIEVPSDKYDDAIRAMQDRIDKGQIKGVKKADDIVRKGYITYEQAKNIAKAGTIESLAFDAYNGVVSASCSGGISFAVTFFCAYRDGQDFDAALESAMEVGFQVGGVTFASSIISGQLAKAGFNTLFVNASDEIVSLLGSKASSQLVNAFNSGTEAYAKLHGASAMKSASKMLRSNFVTGLVTTLVLSAGDIYNIFQGKISSAQLFKNVVNTGAGVAGGLAGWTGGAAAGAKAGAVIGSILPGLGTGIGATVGGFIGGLAGGTIAGSVAGDVSKKVTDVFIDDDSKEMLNILEGEFQIIAVDYLLNKEEANETIENLKQDIDESTLKDMYQSNDRKIFAHNLLEKSVLPVVKNRKRIKLPTNEDLIRGLRTFLENPTLFRDNMNKPNIKIGVMGHIGHGKTTLSAAISLVLSETDGCHAEFIDYSQLDNAQEEVSMGVPINISYIEYETTKRHYHHIDCPKHADYVKSMLTGAVQLDGVILVVSGADGPMPQTREHILLARQLGIQSIVVFLNKADQVADPELLELVEMEIRELFSLYGFLGDDIPVITGSALLALEGDADMKMKIYELIQAVDEYIPTPEQNPDLPFMMTITDVFEIKGRGTLVVGDIERGVLHLNDNVDIVGYSYNVIKSEVLLIESCRRFPDIAVAGDSICIGF